MFQLPRRNKLTVPNSLALFAAAILIWSSAGTGGSDEDFQSACTHPDQGQHSAMPEMTAAPRSCTGSNGNNEIVRQAQDKALASAQSAGFSLLYLSAKSLVGQ